MRQKSHSITTIVSEVNQVIISIMDHVNDSYFQVSVKGLFFKDKKLMMIQEENETWELAGWKSAKR